MRKERKKTSLVWTSISDEKFTALVAESDTIAAVLRYFGMDSRGGNNKTVRARIKHLKIDDSHIARGCTSNRGRTFRPRALPLDQVLVKNSTYNRLSLKTRIISEGIVEYKCSECSLGDLWRDKKIVLVLDHINGINNDNRVENLRFLCPNCNSQTPTFAGRNRPDHMRAKISRCPLCDKKKIKSSKVCYRCVTRPHKVPHPSTAQLQEDMAAMNWSAMGRKYGVSDNAVRKWARQAGLLN
jgi:5-methylcytosine-specific restriction endonuclease McrA